MARLTSRNNIKGAIGPVIFYESQGRMLVRSKPESVENPRTPAQQQHRMRFAAASKFLKPFREVVKETFTEFAGKSDGYSAAMSYNMRFGLKGGFPLVEVDYHKALISYGNAVLPAGLTIAQSGDGFELSWDTAPIEGALDNDWVIPVLCGDTWHRASLLEGVLRKEGKCTIQIPIGYASAKCWVFVKATKANWGRHLSMSEYVGELER